jgi:hypothetical protein
MSSWAIVAIVAIIIWGIVSLARARAGIITDEDGNQSYAPRDEAGARIAAEEALREIAQLRERIEVLERIATDNNSLSAREQARLTAEIDALRAKDNADSKEELKS